jgi:hypothetical protein
MVPQFERLRDRLLLGGAMEVTKVGPKDCTVDMRSRFELSAVRLRTDGARASVCSA